jgi:hypothetical protein
MLTVHLRQWPELLFPLAPEVLPENREINAV